MRRSPGVCGDRGFVFAPPRCGWGKGRVSETSGGMKCSRAQVNVFDTVPLAQRNILQRQSSSASSMLPR